MKGVVGSGKSTISEKMRQLIEEKGNLCIVEGTDKYCKDGYQMQDAAQKVRTAILAVVNSDAKNPVIIIDTCGEKTSKTVFDVDLSSWRFVNAWVNLDKSNMDGYLSWSLRKHFCKERAYRMIVIIGSIHMEQVLIHVYLFTRKKQKTYLERKQQNFWILIYIIQKMKLFHI